MRTKLSFEADVCDTCTQTTNYITQVDKGIALIVKAIGVAVKRKGINIIHPPKEMLAETGVSAIAAAAKGQLTHSMSHNLSRARNLGLIDKVPGESGNWKLTWKGIAFLKGEPVPKHVIIDKRTAEAVCFYEPAVRQITLGQALKEKDEPFWAETIEEGQVVTKGQTQAMI